MEKNVLIFTVGALVSASIVYLVMKQKETVELEVVPEKPLIDPEVLKKFVDESVDGLFKQAELEVKYGVVSVNDKPDEKDLEKTYEDVGIKKVREESEEPRQEYEEKASRSTKSYNDVKYEDLKQRYESGGLNIKSVAQPSPYIINESDYFDDPDFIFYDKDTLTYYAGRSIFVDVDNDGLINNIVDIIGEEAANLVQEQCRGRDSYIPVYARNDKLKIDYEIMIVDSSYEGGM